MSGPPIPPGSTSPLNGAQPQALLPYPAPHTNSHHEPQSAYIAARQMIPQQLWPQYGYEPSFSSRSRKRTRAGSGSDTHRRVNRNFETQQQLPTLPADGSAPAPEPPEIMYPAHSEHSSSHPSSARGFPAPISLPVPQQHHHHRLPSHARLRSARASASSHGPGSVVGLPGMPQPRPRPPAPKTRFTVDDDVVLVDLKEHKNLAWKQIKEFFPGRKMTTLQVRYCTKLKVRNLVWTDDMVSLLLQTQRYYVNPS